MDSNQNWIKPGVVLTSMLKRVDVAVFETIKSVTEKKFQAGVVRYGLKDTGVDWALDANNANLWSTAEQQKMTEIKKQIIKRDTIYVTR